MAPSTPSGWTLLASVASGSNFRERVYARIADGTAADDFATSWSGSTFRFAEMRSVAGCASAASWIVGETSGGTGTTATIHGVTTVSPTNLLLGFWDTSEAATVKSVTEGWEQDAGIWTPVDSTQGETPGPTGDLVITFSGSGPWVGVMIAVPPPAGPRPGSLSLLGVGR